MRRLACLLVLSGCGKKAVDDTGPALPDLDHADQATNVLILFLDDLGTDQVASWAEHPDPPSTPVLDALGEVGVRFRNAYSAPVCSPARAALLTGRTARRTGFGDLIETHGDQALPLSEALLPDLLDGVATVAIGKWHLAGSGAAGWETHANDQGFGAVRVTPGNLGSAYLPANAPVGYNNWERLHNGTLSVDTRYATTAQVNDARDWIATAPEPWVAYVAFSAAHSPFHAPPAHLLDAPVDGDAPPADRYAAMIRALDREIGRLLHELPPEVLERTMIVAMGDNGTPGEVVRAPWEGSKAKNTVYEGGTNVPLIVAGAGVTADGAWSEALVHVVDVLPTVLAVHGTPLPSNIDGLPLQPLLASPGDAWEREVLFTERFGPIGPPPGAREEIAARDSRFKLIEVRTGGILATQELFDLSGRYDDGPDLLQGALDAEAQDALDRLSAAIADYRSIPFEGE